ncbi:MAG: EAL domain-containing protein [Magnetococcales bacterium]|nr:EAL domain-containing protein [Magnetococcales bacterium]
MAIKPSILIVDDRKENLLALEGLLEGCGADIHKASSGNEALSLLLNEDFALVLLDVQMPEMDGFEMAELMRGNDKTRQIPIIFVTAISKEQHYVFKGYDSGAVDYLFKPIESKILCGKVRVFLELWTKKQQLLEVLEQKSKLEAKLKQQAEFDTLTGLPNRALFHDRLKQALLMVERTKTQGALMFIDLDRFKYINDNMGHDYGDQLLVQAAKRLVSCVRKADTVARFGGDEFTVIIQNIHHESLAELIAKKINAELIKPFKLGVEEVQISGSIGITIFPHDSLDFDELLKNADTAMYKTKESGRNGFHFFTSEMNHSAHKRMAFDVQLQAALELEEFVIHYQPIIDISSRRVEGVEALVRWQHPGGKLKTPKEFIPLMEESGLIVPLGKWVLKKATQQAKKWFDMGLAPLRLSINISNRQLDDNDEFIESIKNALFESGLAAESLELEITENSMMEKLNNGIETCDKLKELGVKISLDDFGTGYSSIGLLRKLPIEKLKIDTSFINGVNNDPDNAATVAAIITMAKKLDLAVVAEGVETKDQLIFLEQNRCCKVQGYYFFKPLPVDKCTNILFTQESPDKKTVTELNIS